MYFCSQTHKQLKCLSEVEVLLRVCLELLGISGILCCAGNGVPHTSLYLLQGAPPHTTGCASVALLLDPVQVARSSTGPPGAQSISPGEESPLGLVISRQRRCL